MHCSVKKTVFCGHFVGDMLDFEEFVLEKSSLKSCDPFCQTSSAESFCFLLGRRPEGFRGLGRQEPSVAAALAA